MNKGEVRLIDLLLWHLVLCMHLFSGCKIKCGIHVEIVDGA